METVIVGIGSSYSKTNNVASSGQAAPSAEASCPSSENSSGSSAVNTGDFSEISEEASSDEAGDKNPVNMQALTGAESSDPAVALAEKYLGRDSYTLKGDLPTFQAAGGYENNCADFVSSLLQNTGRIDSHEVGVWELANKLEENDWERIEAAMARPGDVWIADDYSHTEIVQKAGDPPTLIGSNNLMGENGEYLDFQRIGTAYKDSGMYYHMPDVGSEY